MVDHFLPEMLPRQVGFSVRFVSRYMNKLLKAVFIFKGHLNECLAITNAKLKGGKPIIWPSREVGALRPCLVLFSCRLRHLASYPWWISRGKQTASTILHEVSVQKKAFHQYLDQHGVLIVTTFTWTNHWSDVFRLWTFPLFFALGSEKSFGRHAPWWGGLSWIILTREIWREAKSTTLLVTGKGRCPNNHTTSTTESSFVLSLRFLCQNNPSDASPLVGKGK